MKIINNGKFAYRIPQQQLVSGIANTKSQGRNIPGLSSVKGMIGQDGRLTSFDDLTQLDVSSLGESFPFPQLFCFSMLTLVCGQTKIYEYSGGFNLKITTSPGYVWSAVDFGNYIMMTNGVVTVVRDAITDQFAESTLPVARSVCDYNGQVFAGGL